MGVVLRLIILAIIIGFIWSSLRRLLFKSSAPVAQASAPKAIAMRPCHYCGLHIGEPEAIQAQGYFFCCTAHRDAFLAALK